MSIIYKSIVSKYFEDFSIGENIRLPKNSNKCYFSMFQVLQVIMILSIMIKNFVNKEAPGNVSTWFAGFNSNYCWCRNFSIEVRDILGLIEVSGKMLKPVYREDTLYTELVISNLISQNTTGIIEMKALVNNQNNVLVFEGFQKYLVKKKINDK